MNNIEVGDTVRLVKHTDVFGRFSGDFVVKKTEAECVVEEGVYMPFSWFEVMEGANEPKIGHNDWDDQLEAVMECEAELQRFKDLVWRLSLDYHEGEIKGWHFLRAVQGVMAEYIREDVNGIYED